MSFDASTPPKAIARKRGRPSNKDSAKRREVDSTIARTIYRLLSWGFTLRSKNDVVGAAEVVGQLAREVLNLSDQHGNPLGPDRIEQIHKTWMSSADGLKASPGGWRSADGERIVVRPWSTVKVKAKRPSEGLGLIDRRPVWHPKGPNGPKATDAEIIAELLRSGGQWPHELPRLDGDDALTEKAAEAWAKAPRGAWNAELQAQAFEQAEGIGEDHLSDSEQNGVEK